MKDAGKNLESNQYSPLIIGCGKIAGFFECNIGPEVYGHAEAYYRSDRFGTIGFCDIDLSKAEKLAKRYNSKYFFSDISNSIAQTNPDVISVCTPDETHYGVVSIILEHDSKPKIILLEKPACSTLEELYSLIKLSAEKNVKIVVNHTRRFDERYRAFKDFIMAKEYGEIVRVDAIYYGGWRHNGIHIVDTLDYLLGSNLKIISKTGVSPSRLASDPCYEFILGLESANGEPIIYFHTFNEGNYQLFEFDFKFQKGRVRIENFESQWTFEKRILNNMDEMVLEKDQKMKVNMKISPIENAIKIIADSLDGIASFKGYLIGDVVNTMSIIDIGEKWQN